MPGSGGAAGVTPSALQSAAMAPYGLNVSMPAAYPPVLVPITGAQTVGFGAKSLGASNAMSPFAAVPGDARMPARAPGTGGEDVTHAQRITGAAGLSAPATAAGAAGAAGSAGAAGAGPAAALAVSSAAAPAASDAASTASAAAAGGRRHSLISMGSNSSIGFASPLTGAGSRRNSLINDSLGIGIFNALHGGGVSGPMAAGKGGSSPQLPAVNDPLGIGLFTAMREAGMLPTSGAAGSASGQRSRRNSMLGPSGDIEKISLPLPAALPPQGPLLPARGSQAFGSAGGSAFLPDAPKKDEAGATDVVQNEGEGPEGAAAGGAGAPPRQRGRRSSIVGPPLSPGEIEQVVRSFEVDEKVTAGATVTT
jgi:hypothetical protein